MKLPIPRSLLPVLVCLVTLFVVGCSAAPPHFPSLTAGESDSSTLPTQHEPSISPPPTVEPTDLLSASAPAHTVGPWAWHRTILGAEIPPLLDIGSWVVGDRYVVVGQLDTGDEFARWVVVTSDDGIDWQSHEAPARIRKLFTGTLIDGRLWFVARVVGTPEDSRQLVSTSNGEDWEFLGPAENMGARDGARFLARVGDLWVANVYRSTPREPFPLIDQDVRISSDGIRWTTIATPGAPNTNFSGQPRMFGDTLVVRGYRNDGDTGTAFWMTSPDGRRWDAEDFPNPLGGVADHLCAHTRCVAVGFGMSPEGNDAPAAWTSTDGLHWTAAEAEMPPARYDANMDQVFATPSGYIAQGGPGGDAWLSQDGTAWRHIQVMRPGEANPNVVGIVGDRIVAFGDGGGENILDVWIGSVAAMGG